MSPKETLAPDHVNDEILSLIATLHATGQRLEELTGGEVDTVADEDGRAFVLRHAQERWRRNDASKMSAIVNALPARLALIDAQGVIVSVNQVWQRFAETHRHESGADAVGFNYLENLDLLPGDGASNNPDAADGIRGVLSGRMPAFSTEYPSQSPTERRWFLMTVTAVSDDAHIGAVVMHLDVTERKRAEEMLAQASEHVVRGRRTRVRAELAVFVGATAVLFALSVRFNWLESPMRWVLSISPGQLAETVLVMLFVLASLAAFALRRWHESESELTTREQSQVVLGRLREELERRIKARTEELARTNESLSAEILERRRSELAAERALQRLSEAQRVGQIGDWEWDLASQAITWSPQVYELLGRDPRRGPPDFLDHNAIYDADSQRLLMEKVALAIESGEPQSYELRGRLPNGEFFDVLARAAPRRDDTGRIVALFGTVQDITERKRSEAAIKESERRYHSLFENMLEGYAYCRTVFEGDVLSDFIYLEVNTAFGTLTGLKDVIGKKVSEVIPGFLESNKEFIELYGRVALSGRPEKREAFAKGPDVWLSITAYSASRDQFVAVFDNITTRKGAEDALRRSAEQLEVERARLVMAQQLAKVGSWETDLSTGIVLWSAETHRIHETTPATYHPAHGAYLAFVHPDDRAALDEAFKRSIDRRSDAVIEHRIVLTDGSLKFVEQRWQVLLDTAGNPSRAVGTCQDITERKTAAEKIIHLSRVQAMLSGISSVIVRVRDRENLFKEACRIAVEAGEFRMSLIAIVDPDLQRTVPVASAGTDEGLLAAVNDLLSSPEAAPRTMVARAIRQKKAIVSNDSQKDPGVLLGPRYTDAAIRSIAVLPLIVSDEAVGVLALYSSEVEFFHEEEMKLLTELADDIAFGLSAIGAHAERERADEALRSSLKEKEALLKEVHHRVKNNMQVITSLLRLESNRIDHATTKSVLKDMQSRIQAMAALHEAVYRSNNFAQVDLAVYLRQLTGQLGRSLVAVPGQISFRLDLLSIALDLDQAIPCGLIVNELVSNALKHAFPGGRQGEVRIELEQTGGENLRLRITDNGLGLPPDFDANRAKSLGLQLVADLARQLGGSLKVGPGPEAVFEVTFSPNHK